MIEWCCCVCWCGDIVLRVLLLGVFVVMCVLVWILMYGGFEIEFMVLLVC